MNSVDSLQFTRVKILNEYWDVIASTLLCTYNGTCKINKDNASKFIRNLENLNS